MSYQFPRLIAALLLAFGTSSGLFAQENVEESNPFESKNDQRNFAYSAGYLSGQDFRKIVQRMALSESELATDDVVAGFKDAISKTKSRVDDIESRRIRFDSVFSYARRAKARQTKFLENFSKKTKTTREPTGAFWRQVKSGQGRSAESKDVLEVLIKQQGANGSPDAVNAMISVKRLSLIAPRLVEEGILKNDAAFEIVAPGEVNKYLQKFILEEARPPLLFRIEIQRVHSPQDLTDFDMDQVEEELAYERLDGVRDLQNLITDEIDYSTRRRAQKFLQENKAKANVQVADNGLQFIVLAPGKGKSADWGDQVSLRFRILATDGTVHMDSRTLGDPVILPVWRQVAWAKGLRMMKQGSRYRFFYPPGQGMIQQGGDIEIVELELVKFVDEFHFPKNEDGRGGTDFKEREFGGGDSGGGDSGGTEKRQDNFDRN